MSDSEPLVLEAEDLHTYYGASHVLHGVTFAVRRGETISLMGRNGMGKTTTLRSVTGLTRPRRGRVRVRGLDVTQADIHEIARLRIAMVPEGRGIFRNLTVREHLQIAVLPGIDGRNHWPQERILELFPRLADRLDNMGDQLSGGEQQMLTIARALTMNPVVLLLDEATEGLAPLVRREIWRVLRTIKESGVAAIVVDKDIRGLSAISDRSLILVKGRIVFDGPTAELSANPEMAARHLGI